MAKLSFSPKLKTSLEAQIPEEVEFFREARKRRHPFWSRNERLALVIKHNSLSTDSLHRIYNIRHHHNSKTDRSRSNINIPKMQGFVNTMLSKVDAPPNITYIPGEEADLIKAKRLNAFKDKIKAPASDNWAFKDLLGKKQAIMYGRAVYEYHSEHIPGLGFKSHLSNVDVYDFLIDPAGGGLDLENARALGRSGIIRTEKELKEGVKSGKYIRAAVKHLIDEVQADKSDEEAEDDKDNNRYISLIQNRRRLEREDEYKFYEWHTTYEHRRYTVTIHLPTRTIIRVKETEELYGTHLWPYWSYATDPDLVEFWTPSPADSVAEIFMGITVAVNQQFDNNEQINKPMVAFDSGAVENPALLKYRRDGKIPFKAGTDLSRAFKVFKPDALQNNERMIAMLDNIAQTESGITAATKGLSEEDKVAIFEGNLANVADRLGLNNKSFANGYHKLAVLFNNGVNQNLLTKEAIKIIGNDGIDYQDITKKDVKPKERDFDIDIISSDPELNGQQTDKENKITFLTEQSENGNINAKAVFEMQAEIVGFEPTQIKRLLDTDNFANAEVMSEAASDFQEMVGGKLLEPNKRANNAYKQKMLDLLISKHKGIKEDTQKIILAYLDELQPIIISNTIREAKKQATENLQNMSEEGVTALATPPEEEPNQ